MKKETQIFESKRWENIISVEISIKIIITL